MLEHDHDSLRLSPFCWLYSQLDESTATVRLRGEFDLACEDGFRYELGRVLADTPDRVVLDLRELEFMDSTGLQMLLALDASARGNGFEFTVLCAAEGAVRTVLRQTGLDGLLPVMDPWGRVPATDSPV